MPKVSGWEIVENTFDAPPNLASAEFAWCPSGKKVLGGGFLVFNNPSHNTLVEQSQPASQTSRKGEGWFVWVFNPGPDQNVRVTIYAICAQA
jgi:hypothetical protein